MAPGTRQNVSQIDGARPSSATAPSIWYAAVAAPQTKSRPRSSGVQDSPQWTVLPVTGVQRLARSWLIRIHCVAQQCSPVRSGPPRRGGDITRECASGPRGVAGPER